LVAAGQEICVVFLFGARLGEKPPLRHNFGFSFGSFFPYAVWGNFGCLLLLLPLMLLTWATFLV